MCNCRVKGLVMFIIALGLGAAMGFYGSKVANKGVAAPSDTAVASEEDNSGKTVTATVNGKNIYKEDVLATIKQLSIKDEEVKKVYSVVLNQMVTDMLIEDKIAKAGVDTSDLYKAKLEELKKQLVKTIFFEKLVSDQIKESDIKKEYETIKADNMGKKEAHARHILVKTEEEAQQVIKDLDKGADFAKLAKERSSDATASNGGDVGYFAEGEIVPEFSKAVFSMKPGEYTKTPVKTALGFHVIKLEEFRDRKVPSYDEMKASVRNGMAQKLVFTMARDMRAEADVKLFDMDGKPIEATKEGAAAPETAPAAAVPAPAPAPAAAEPAKK